MAASSENGAENRLKDGGSTRANVPVRWRLRMPTRLLPRVGERPAGADIGVADLESLLLSFFAGDLGFRMDRGRDGAARTGLLYVELQRPSLLETAGVEDDLVRTKVGALKKSLSRRSELALERFEKSRAGSTFSKSSTSSRSTALRLLGDETGIAGPKLVLVLQVGRGAPSSIEGSANDGLV